MVADVVGRLIGGRTGAAKLAGRVAVENVVWPDGNATAAVPSWICSVRSGNAFWNV